MIGDKGLNFQFPIAGKNLLVRLWRCYPWNNDRDWSDQCDIFFTIFIRIKMCRLMIKDWTLPKIVEVKLTSGLQTIHHRWPYRRLVNLPLDFFCYNSIAENSRQLLPTLQLRLYPLLNLLLHLLIAANRWLCSWTALLSSALNPRSSHYRLFHYIEYRPYYLGLGSM